MAFSKKFLLVGLVFAILLISSEVVSALRDLAETTASTQNSNADHYHVDEATLGSSGYNGGYRCRYGHCGNNGGNRCRHGHCGGHGPGETATTTENSNTDHHYGGGGGHYGGGGGGHYGGGGHHEGGAHEAETKN